MRNVLSCLLVIFFIFTNLWSQSTDSLQIDSMLAEADEKYKANEYEAARLIAQECLELSEQNDDHKNTATSLVLLGKIYFGQERYFDSDSIFFLAKEIRLDLLKDTCGAASVCNNLSLRADTDDRALKFIKEAIQLGKVEGCSDYGFFLLTAGKIQMDLDNFSESEKLLKKSVSFFKTEKDTSGQLKSSYELIVIHLKSKTIKKRLIEDIDELIKLFQTQSIVDSLLLAQYYEAKGVALLALQNNDLALKNFEDAKAIYLKVPNHTEALSTVHYNVACAYENLGSWEKAQSSYEDAIKASAGKDQEYSFLEVLERGKKLAKLEKQKQRHYNLLFLALLSITCLAISLTILLLLFLKKEKEFNILKHDIIKNGLISTLNFTKYYLQQNSHEEPIEFIKSISKKLQFLIDYTPIDKKHSRWQDLKDIIGQGKKSKQKKPFVVLPKNPSNDNDPVISLEKFTNDMYELAKESLINKPVENLTIHDSFLYQNFAISKELRKHLFAITLEAFTNINKSANCHKASIQFTCDEEGLTLEIIDDGVGFDVNQPRKEGSGLKNFAIRAKEMKARLKIESAKGKGTKIWLQIPNFPNS